MEVLRDCMSTDVQTCQPQDSVQHAAEMMRDVHVGAIPVCDQDNHLLGMVTDRDIVIRCIAERKEATTPIQEIMSEQMEVASPTTSSEDCAETMAKMQIRRMPVVENGKLQGIVSLGDLSLTRTAKDEAGIALSEISEEPHLHH
ncbi:CBS domain-containing protein [Salsuginibacillus kocurii]|uniref:CBS domain-containing protein n=1 Tax=Salsuginibacillus kocurii TaxID=427078 RepID=UPI0003760003|nr:CBS domain-containing protein [Salsuginibacillus kocurii]